MYMPGVWKRTLHCVLTVSWQHEMEKECLVFSHTVCCQGFLFFFFDYCCCYIWMSVAILSLFPSLLVLLLCHSSQALDILGLEKPVW